MNNYEQKTEQVLTDIETCFQEMGLKSEGRKCVNGYPGVSCQFEYENHRIRIAAIYYPPLELVDFAIHYGIAPREKIYRLCQLINHINTYLIIDHFAMDPDCGGMLLHTGIFVTRYFLNKEEFKKVLEQMMDDGYNYFPLLCEQIFTNRNPRSIMKTFLKKELRRIKDMKEHAEYEEEEKEQVEKE